MPQANPFPLPESLSNKVNSPALLAWFQQFGTDGYLSAEEIKAMKSGLDYLYQNSVIGGQIQTKLLSVGAITVVGNTVSVASASALILGVEVINAEGISFMVPFAGTGKIRIDLVVLNSDGDLLRIAGAETDSGNIAIPPINLVPPTAVIVTEINVTDADLVTIIPTYLSFDEEQAIHNANNPSASNPFATVNDTTLFKVLSQGDRPIRMSDGDGDTILELDDRGKLVSNLDGDFLHLPSEFYPVGSVLKIHNPSSADLFLLPTPDVPYISINQFSIFVDEFSPVTLRPGIASLKKSKSFDVDGYEEWILTYELFDFSKEALGLENVDNTYDMEKPVSVFQAAAITAAESNATNQAVTQSLAYIRQLKSKLVAKVALDTNISSLSGVPSEIQGIFMASGDVVFLMSQTDLKQNGLWVISSGSWQRPVYFDANTNITRQIIEIQQGTYKGKSYRAFGTIGFDIVIYDVVYERLVNILTPSSSVTVTTSQVQITSYNLYFPPYTFKGVDELKIEQIEWSKVGTNNASTCRLKLSNTNDYSTAQDVLILAASGGNINLKGTRTYKVTTGNLTGLMSSAANGIFNDNVPTNVAKSTIALDWTQPIYGFVSLQITSGLDSAKMETLIISKN